MSLETLLDAQMRLKRWPKKKQEKLEALVYLQGKIETGAHYSEKEINTLLKTWHSFDDAALLRRELFNNFLLERSPDGRDYWRQN